MTPPRTIEMAVTASTFIRDTPPIAVVRGVCEHGVCWVKSYSIYSTYYTDGIGTDWSALDALKETTPAPSCEFHR